MTTEPTPTHGPSEGITEQPAAPAPPLPEAPSDAITATPTAPTPTEPVPTEPALPPKPGTDWSKRADYLLLVLLLVLGFFLASFVATNTDLWLHLATGKRISEGTFEFGVDPYSWATEARDQKPAVPWIHQSWLFSWLVFQIHESSMNGAGLVVLKAILFTLGVALLAQIGWTPTNRWFILICLIMAVLASSGRLLLQPMVISLLFVAITMFLLDRAGLFVQPSEPPDMEPRLPPWKGGPREGWLWYCVPLFALWANLDSWFILGPLLLGLAWAGTGLARKFGTPLPAPGKTVGMVFGASLLACLLNPFHVRAFQLPPELAYLVVSVTDPLHIPMPAELIAGGRAMKELRKLDPDLSWTISPLSSQYWSDVRFGKNIAAIAFYPLLLLGLLGFLLVGLKSQKQGPGLQPVRFLIWLVLAVPALALHRTIPFFAFVAAPLTAMTLGEFLQWQQANAAGARSDRGLLLARYCSIPFVLLLIAFAWPGWLHGSGEFNSRRRVAWEVRADQPLQNTAETLQRLHESGQGKNVLNMDFFADQDKVGRGADALDQVATMANVIPWFAPGVKHGLDSRLPLFADHIEEYAALRKGISDFGVNRDWPAVLMRHNVNQLAVVNTVVRDPSGRENFLGLMRFWLDTKTWRHRHADRRALVFSWAGAGKSWPITTAYDDLNAAAFGDISLSLRPPLKGTPIPVAPTSWIGYLDGTPPPPAILGEFGVQQVRFGQTNAVAVSENARGARFTGTCAALAPLQLMPGSGMAIGPEFLALYYPWFGLDKHSALMGPRDIGPAGIPVLSIRIARRAVAENPLDLNAQITVAAANETLRRVQEDRWIGYEPHLRQLDQAKLPSWQVAYIEANIRRAHPSALRDRMRQYQQIASYYNAVQLQPDDWRLHETLARIYLENNLLDLALEHMQLAEVALQGQRSSVRSEALKGFDEGVKEYRNHVESLEKNVKQRMAKWKENYGKNNFQSAWAAARSDYFDLSLGQKAPAMPMGLGKKALEILGAIKADALADNERMPYHQFRYDLLLSMGRADLVAAELAHADVKKGLPPEIYARYQFWTAATIGDYESMDTALTTLEKSMQVAEPKFAEDVKKICRASAAVYFVTGTAQSFPELTYYLFWPSSLAGNMAIGARNEHLRLRSELLSTLTLHGIVMLEAGDTAKAHRYFHQAMNDWKDEVPFGDRPIAQRYLKLLDEQKGPRR